ncbi:MAG: DUF47 family protein [bacterium]
MLRHFLPKTTNFFDYFERHAALAITTCQELLALTSGQRDPAEAARRIKDLEHEADEITHRCIEALHRTFITPFDRGDIHSLITRLDDVVDSVDAAVSRMALYEIKEMRAEAVQLAEVLVKATTAIEETVRCLRNLKDIEAINAKCRLIHEMENAADAILRSALVRLFKEADAVLIIKWKEIYERLEKAADRCEEVANIIQGVVIEAS